MNVDGLEGDLSLVHGRLGHGFVLLFAALTGRAAGALRHEIDDLRNDLDLAAFLS